MRCGPVEYILEDKAKRVVPFYGVLRSTTVGLFITSAYEAGCSYKITLRDSLLATPLEMAYFALDDCDRRRVCAFEPRERRTVDPGDRREHPIRRGPASTSTVHIQGDVEREDGANIFARVRVLVVRNQCVCRQSQNSANETQDTSQTITMMIRILFLALTSFPLSSAFTTPRNAFVGRAVTSRYVC